jgi:[acyl-carrier-protein] S-malonyltransferase
MVVFLFPGQGAQYPGMGLDLLQAGGKAAEAAQKVFDCASQTLGRDMIALLGDSDAETLKRTDVSQPALCAASLAASAALAALGITAAACAGFSLGEYPAFACAGVISMEDCFRLMDARGKAMQSAADKIAAQGSAEELPGMAAVLGLAPARVEELIAQWAVPDLYAANSNSPKQVVVSGSAAALAQAETRFKEAGARRVVRLQVAGPFHSPFMKEAAEAFAPALEAVSFRDPLVPLFSNVTGKQLASGAEAKSLALRQIVEGVRWTDEEAAIAAINPSAVIETGPGKVLQGLWRDTGSTVPVYGAGSAAEILELKELLT